MFLSKTDSLDELTGLWAAGTETAGLGGKISQTGELRELQQELQVTECLYERDDRETEGVRSSQYIIYLLCGVVLDTRSRSQPDGNTKSQGSELSLLPTSSTLTKTQPRTLKVSGTY